MPGLCAATGLRVVKFGGTSVANGLPEVVRRIEDSRALGPTVAVVSAFAGLTDQLTEIANGERLDLETLISELARRCGDAGSPHLLDLRRLADRAAREGGLSGAARHTLLAVGERLSAEAVVRNLRRSGVAAQAVDGTEVLVACGRTGAIDADASALRTRDRLGRAGAALPIVTGFIAASDGTGHAVTLGRGASDLSATLLASFLDAEGVEIWTDTDGIWSADPNRLEHARPIRQLSYGEAETMARWGAKVLHPDTAEPVVSRGIPVHVRSTFDLDAPGSRIDARTADECRSHPVRAVARLSSAPGDHLVWIAGIGANAETFSPELPDGTVVSRLVERPEGDRPRVEAVLVMRDQADEVESIFHRDLVERPVEDLLRRTA
ncbi:MAG: hypothetical protein MPN21_02535 [Thermoanaerobaculia bacterium]|nr:hypothetical protein [Thermoanaerobaculia bacterium]